MALSVASGCEAHHIRPRSCVERAFGIGEIRRPIMPRRRARRAPSGPGPSAQYIAEAFDPGTTGCVFG